ncbi:MAG: alpha/beta fold hydrolase [Acidimicrobiaceae bacterium]|nr:alpha/beta hydrolase [Acidimicrobiaceae bacterium]MCY3651177.1 alpha/beta hydrolase [Acidimicrobiaceae bacterium]MDE0517318.1 alpha/beta hydrolase [Acidimicrobiaceae bacterium]MXZ96851.1 alpha/beta fold hydrolase [Acidimicrobiaceae bacterium]MYF42996.1 alpha/beta fold hydrolase [Acidimicrobiaceae bacterium]
MTTVELSDLVVNYRRRGSGPPVVLLHGLAEDLRSWDAVAAHLGEFAVYTLDLRGHGRTTAGEGAGTLSQLSDDLAAFLNAVTGPAAVVGYSLGGTIGLRAAVDTPALIRHLIVVATSSVVGTAAAEFFDGRIAQLEDHDWHGFAAGLRDDTAKQVVTEADIGTLASKRLDAVGDGRGYINAARAMTGVRSEPLNPLLARIEVPVDVVGAEFDVFCPRRASDIIVDAVAGCRYHEVAGAGHLLSVDQPDAYGKLVARLLHERGAA